MSKLKQQFADLRKNTPKRVQWLLMGAAFVVVLILLTLMMNKTESTPNLSQTNSEYAKLNLTTDKINWGDTVVGDRKSETITVTATKPVKITKVSASDTDISGFKHKDTCSQMGQIDSKLSCIIELTYEPTGAQEKIDEKISIDWYDANETDTMTDTQVITVTLGATEPVKEAPTPVVIPEPVAEPEPVVEEEIIIEEEPEIEEQIIEEVEAIAPAFEIEEIVPSRQIAKQACSDFAFPGYNNAGLQIGWIKPEGGAYKFHPFSDTECNNPTGTYNPDNGIITDNSGNRIGTDAEHMSYSVISNGELPALSNVPAIKPVNRATQLEGDPESLPASSGAMRLGSTDTEFGILRDAPEPDVDYLGSQGDENTVVSSKIHDRQFLLRQYKPIPATIVSDIRADPEALEKSFLPVRATVDRNVYSDSGRNVIIPTGTLLMGYVTGKLPGPYTTVGRMQIKWYQFILPNGVEFNFGDGQDPFSGDAQGRSGVPGHGSTDYIEQFFMPMLTAFVPAVINLINPVADAFVNQIDLDNNTVVQSGTMRSSELAKNEIITAWNQVAQKLLVDMMDNTVPPFTIAAGTRITVYSPVDLMVTCGKDNGKKCAIKEYGTNKRRNVKQSEQELTPADDGSWVGQARSFQVTGICREDENGLYRAPSECFTAGKTSVNGYSCTTLQLYCESLNYQSKKALQYEEYTKDQAQQYQQKVKELGGPDSQQFKEEILDVKYNAEGQVENPYANTPAPTEEAAANTLTCIDGTAPDANGCCTGEIYTDMGPEMGFNCCPSSGGDCFPPLI